MSLSVALFDVGVPFLGLSQPFPWGKGAKQEKDKTALKMSPKQPKVQLIKSLYGSV